MAVPLPALFLNVPTSVVWAESSETKEKVMGRSNIFVFIYTNLIVFFHLKQEYCVIFYIFDNFVVFF
jgi:hypothetical protein